MSGTVLCSAIPLKKKDTEYRSVLLCQGTLSVPLSDSNSCFKETKKKKQVKAEFRTSLLTHFCEEKDKVGAD